MSEAPVVRTGGCMCQQVRYSVTGEPLRVGICHCTDCRQSSGSAFTFFAIWPIDAFAGEGPTSSYKGRSFCPICGSPVFSLPWGSHRLWRCDLIRLRRPVVHKVTVSLA